MANRSLFDKLRERWGRSDSRRRRFHPVQIVLIILAAGWVPLILTLWLTYNSLEETLERRLVVDRRTLIESLSALIASDLTRTGEVMQYYQTLPQMLGAFGLPAGDEKAQSFLEGIYYGQPQIDGMFLADRDGRLIAALPRDETMIGASYPSLSRLELAQGKEGYFISPVHHRLPDGRIVTAIVVAVRDATGELQGYIGAQVLVERIGRRLQEYNFGESSTAQLFDQTGVSLFQPDLQPRQQLTRANPTLLDRTRGDGRGIFTYQNDLCMAIEMEDTGWFALLRQPMRVAYEPLRRFVAKASILALWMFVGTGVTAIAIGRLYARQHGADERVEREMLESEKILSSMPIGVGVFDPQSRRTLKMNQHLAEMAEKFGRPGQSSSGFDELGFTAPEMFERTVRHEQPYVASEMPVEDAGGQPHFLSLSVYPIKGPRGLLQGILLVAIDITYETFVRSELRAANRAKDQFLAALSHELRNPLSPIVAMVDELEAQSGLDAEGRNALEVIRRNVSLEARLIDDLLDVTRIAHNKLQLDRTNVDAHSAIENAVQVCRPDLVAKDLRIETRLEAARHHLHADGARLSQVFWNLIKNAVKFTLPGGSVTIRTWNEGQSFCAEVADTGVGIEPDRLDNIFERFEQGGMVVTRQFGGLGLGLAISKAMIEAHGGRIEAASDGPGQGARFTIRIDETVPEDLPEPASTPEAPAEPRQTKRGKYRILLVDDHADTTSGMKRLLERRGYDVITAGTVAEAQAVADAETFDLLISDIGLPDGSGIGLMASLRQKRPDLPGIAISGFGMESDRIESRKAGFSDHLIKPVDLAKLMASLAKLLG